MTEMAVMTRSQDVAGRCTAPQARTTAVEGQRPSDTPATKPEVGVRHEIIGVVVDCAPLSLDQSPQGVL